ncbi:hypothetical protein [Mycobacterium sp. DL440]|nr:hypothetical protein [Mycobacterium sp. DL440]
MIKNGTRLKNQVCDRQVIIVKATDGLDGAHGAHAETRKGPVGQ